MLTCVTKVDGEEVVSNYIPQRISNVLKKLKITPDPARVLVGDTLDLNCTGETTHNGIFTFQWHTPANRSDSEKPGKYIPPSLPIVVSKSITLLKVTTKDAGVYNCTVVLFDSTKRKHASANVAVFEHPFLNLSYRNNHSSVVTVTEGRNKLVFKPVIDALPPHNSIAWYKDGVLITRNSSYKISDSGLTVADIQYKHTGVFTVTVGNTEKGLYRNLSYTLIVNVRPTISEAELSYADVKPYMVGREHQLTCTVFAVPQPKILWFWQPCLPDLDACRYTKPIPVEIDSRGDYPRNWIEAMDTGHKMMQGKNKTVGTLVVGRANVTGVYTCMAQNEVASSVLAYPLLRG
ncbi:hypothetical protein CRUP_029127, partial [Coryphaenoides rupestris]